MVRIQLFTIKDGYWNADGSCCYNDMHYVGQEHQAILDRSAVSDASLLPHTRLQPAWKIRLIFQAKLSSGIWNGPLKHLQSFKTGI